MKPNPGYCPAEAKGKRVRVKLVNGKVNGDIAPHLPPGWAADGKYGCRWDNTGFAFDIAEYEVIA